MAGMNGVIGVGYSDAGRRIREAGLRFEEAQRPPPFVPPQCPSLSDSFWLSIAAALKPPGSEIDDRQASELTQIAVIVEATARHFDIPASHLRGSGRSRMITLVRHVAAYLCRELVAASTQKIGAALGNRDHTTIIHAARRIAGLIKTDAELAASVGALREHIGTLEVSVDG